MSSLLLFVLGYAVLAACCYVQNAAFTWSSRSRNSNDANYHRYAAWCSNGIYYLTNSLITVYIIKHSQWYALLLQGAIYTVCASEGSVLMMKKLMQREKDKRAVGANDKYAQIPVADWADMRQRVQAIEDTTAPSKETEKPKTMADETFWIYGNGVVIKGFQSILAAHEYMKARGLSAGYKVLPAGAISVL